MSDTPASVGIQKAVNPSSTTRPRDHVVQMLVKAANQMQEDPAGITSTDLEAPQQVMAALRSRVGIGDLAQGPWRRQDHASLQMPTILRTASPLTPQVK
jgi:hypothetical protein